MKGQFNTPVAEHLQKRREGPREKTVVLDENFIQTASKYIEKYYSSDARKSLGNSNLPENQELTLLLREVQATHDINASDSRKNTLLYKVAGTNEVEFFDFLLTHPNIDVNAQDNRGYTPLMMMIILNPENATMIKSILAHPAINMEIQNHNNMTALMIAEKYLNGANYNYTPVFAKIVELIREKSRTTKWTIHATETAMSEVMDHSWTETTITNWDIETGIPENILMTESLRELQQILEPALTIYKERFGKAYDGISNTLSSIDYDTIGSLKPETVAVRTLFTGIREPIMDSGLQANPLASDAQSDIPVFQELFSGFMEKSSEEKASMLRLFELVNTYVLGNEPKWLLKNPLKNILFSENTASYKDWVFAVFRAFEINSFMMISLAKSIDDAEAPNTPLPWKSIRQLFPTNPEIFDESDHEWLTQFYTKYPDPTILPELIKTDSEAMQQVKAHNELNKKYLLICAPEGITSEEAKKAAKALRDSL